MPTGLAWNSVQVKDSCLRGVTIIHLNICAYNWQLCIVVFIIIVFPNSRTRPAINQTLPFPSVGENTSKIP